VRRVAVLILTGLILAAAGLAGCDGASGPARQPGRPRAGQRQATTTTAQQSHVSKWRASSNGAVSGKGQREAGPEVAGLTEAMRAAAVRPAGGATGLFVDRPASADFRLMTYNVSWDSIFPGKSVTQAERFQRIIKAVDPDVLALQEIRRFSAAEVAALLEAINPQREGTSWHAFRGNSTAIVSKFPLTMTAARLEPHTYRDPAIAVVDLPDERCPVDLCLISSHFKCCGDLRNDPIRQRQADGIMHWLRDAREAGGEVELPARTAFVVAGDLNLVGGLQPLLTLLTGDISDEAVFGSDFAPDWDETALTDAHPLHNGVGPDDYTWRNDDSDFDPGRLDYVVYTDSVLEAVNGFVLNTTSMSEAELASCGLERFDCCADARGRDVDHLPVVVDFRMRTP
jgi:endonuclease/exonuclease/phosphatase family metal-dependent hydrolase